MIVRVGEGWFLTLFIVTFSVAYNFSRFFELKVEKLQLHQPVLRYSSNFSTEFEVRYAINATWLRMDPDYSIYYITFGNCLVMSVIPVSLLSVLNCLIFQGIKRHTNLHNSISSQHRRDNTMAALLSGIVVVFILCHSTKIFANTYEAYQVLYYGELLHWPPWAEVLSKWNHFMLTINASINIFIYVVKDFKFRSALSGICSKFRSSKRNFSARSNLSTKSVATATTLIPLQTKLTSTKVPKSKLEGTQQNDCDTTIV